MRWLDGITDSMDMGLSKPWELVGDGQRSLASCSLWGSESDMTEQLKRTECHIRHGAGHISGKTDITQPWLSMITKYSEL